MQGQHHEPIFYQRQGVDRLNALFHPVAHIGADANPFAAALQRARQGFETRIGRGFRACTFERHIDAEFLGKLIECGERRGIGLSADDGVNVEVLGELE